MDWKQLYETLEGTANTSKLPDQIGYVNTLEVLINLTDKTYMILEDVQQEEAKKFELEEIRELIQYDLSDLVYPDNQEFIEKYKKKVEEALYLLGYPIKLGEIAVKKLNVSHYDKEADFTAYTLAKKVMKSYLEREPASQSEFRLQLEVAKALYKVYESAKDNLFEYSNTNNIKYKLPIIELGRRYGGKLFEKLEKVTDELLKKISEENRKKFGSSYKLIIV